MPNHRPSLSNLSIPSAQSDSQFDDLPEGLSSARSNNGSPGGPDEEPRLKRRSLSNRSRSPTKSDDEQHGLPRMRADFKPTHRVNASASSSADLAGRWPLEDVIDYHADQSQYPPAQHQSVFASQDDLSFNQERFGQSDDSLMRYPTMSEQGISYAEDTSDSARLTSNMAFQPNSRSTDRTHYSPSQNSPLSRSLTRGQSLLKNAAREFKRASVRVVNLASQDQSSNGAVLLDDEGPVDDAMDGSTSYAVHPHAEPNPGQSLGIFGPNHRLRKLARSALLYRWTEPAILVLIIAYVVILSIQSAPSVFSHPRPAGPGYFNTWEDTVLFIMMILFTLEAAARIIVSGLYQNQNYGAKQPLSARIRKRLSYNALSDQFSMGPKDLRYDLNKQNYGQQASQDRHQYSSSSSILQKRAASAANNLLQDTPFRLAVERQRAATAGHSAYLRHSWNRIDLLAIFCFWISFGLSMAGVESEKELYIFRALSVLRAVRLLTFTSGTTTILQSLKKAGPLLVNVAFFVVFAMILFSIIGIQSFKGSFRRECVWIDPENAANFSTGQTCGGSILPDGNQTSFFNEFSDVSVNTSAKGYLCPVGQLCIEGENPYNGTVSYDNIAAAALQIVVIISNNNWTPPMYDMMDADYFVSCLFFIICLLVINFWLLNMFVAVITNTFASIVDETKHSAFASSAPMLILDQAGDAMATTKKMDTFKTSLKKIYNKTQLLWVALVLASVVTQATQRHGEDPQYEIIRKYMELGFTIAFDVELIIRFIPFTPDWMDFFKSGRNATDAFLVVATTVIQIPFIRESAAYPWFTAFQLARFYRVMMAIPRVRRLLVKLTGSISGIINMVFFVMLMTFITALIASQMLRGIIPAEIDDEEIEMTFYQLYNSFLAIYQVLSSEGWVDVLYAGTGSSTGVFQLVVVALLIAGWFMFANFILIQLFIAVINEGFAVAEDEKHKQQLERFVKRSQAKTEAPSWMDKMNPYNYVKARPKALAPGTLPANLALPLRKAVVRDLANDGSETGTSTPSVTSAKLAHAKRKMLNFRRQGSSANLLEKEDADDDAEEGLDRHLGLLAKRTNTGLDVEQAVEERKARQIDFILTHPTYDYSLWLFTNKNSLRRLCQAFVEPGNGDRIFGAKPRERLVLAFKVVIFAAVAASVAIAAVATPLYRQEYYKTMGDVRLSWFNLTEVSLGSVFILEFVVKIIADGFLLTPNAYLLSIWNGLDFFVLLTLIVNIVTALISGGDVSRITRAFKAFRALRLINLSKRMRKTFYDVLIVGAAKLFDASILALLYIIPYAVWGQNLFSSKLYLCNDALVSNKTQCVGEYLASPLQWEFLSPRVWSNPDVYSFDSFRSAFLILFELISIEGWVGVMTSAMSITGVDQQPEPDSAQYNAIFFLIYNLVGGLLVLSLFVSVIIENFTQRSGLSLLTSEQRQWIDLRKLIVRQRPSRRPRHRPTGRIRAWCFDRASHKHGYWSKAQTTLYVIHIAILMTQSNSDSFTVIRLRDLAFLFLTLLYAIDISVRLLGIGWHSFKQNWWNLYDIVTVVGTFTTTIIVLINSDNLTSVQYQKLFLVSIAFKLAQKSNALNQLFKNAVASLPAIMNLFMLWLTLFLVWALLHLEIFSLTRWQSNESHNKNYSTFFKSMVMLSLTSNGEGWNDIMHDYTISPPYCTPSSNFLFSDCGSAPWAYVLYISWCILSMHIFVNMFTGVVAANFSYVFQLYGRVKSINREDMRGFKKAWADIDIQRTGYLKRRQLAPFFARLTGVFDVRIFPPEARIPALVQASRQGSARDRLCSSKQPNKANEEAGLDLTLLSKRLEQIDYDQVAKRKALYAHLYHEATITEEPGRGISFTNMLILLSHYKLMQDSNALQIDELLKRNTKISKVDDLISLDKVRGLLATIHYRRVFQAYRNQKKRSQVSVPVIQIEGSPEAARPETFRSASFDDIMYQPPSPTAAFRASRTPSPTQEPSRLSGEGNPPRRASRESAAYVDESQVLDAIKKSKWLEDED